MTSYRRVRRTAAALALLLPAALLPAVLGPAAGGAPAGPAVSGGELFSPLLDFALAPRDGAGRPAPVRPTAFTAYDVDPDAARDLLGAATTTRPVELTVPDPTGTSVSFSLVERSVMEPGLQARHPEIRSYAGRATDGTGRSIAVSMTRLGLAASVRAPGGGSWYVDPAYRGDTGRYLSYYGASVPEAPLGFVERAPQDVTDLLATAPGGRARAQRVAAGAEVVQRTYRLAFVTDPTYAAYFGSQNVLSAKNNLLTRTNQIYSDDLAIRFLLVDGTDALNLDTVEEASGTDGPCGANPCYPASVYQADPATAGDTPDGCSGAVLTRTEFVLGQLVGADRYDIGHIGLGVNGGGIAGLGVVGGGSKASGCTGLPAPTGDFYAVDYFSHEIGHQMGGNHTFDGDQVNCSSTNRNGSIPLINPSTAVEPGSGSTVMGYAGICGQDNLQPHSDPYFSQRSIDEITAVATADPATVTERQTVTLAGFDTAGDSFQLTYPGATPVTLTRTATGYGKLAVANAVRGLTGCAVNDFDYDGGVGTLPSDDGFTVEFAYPGVGSDCTDLDRLGVTNGTGGVTGFVGVQDDGGPATNQGGAIASGNRAPAVTAPADRTIPARTPFTLSGSGTDVDGDPLTYLWEQNDPGAVTGTSLVSNTKLAGPLFRVFGTYADVTPEGSLTTPAPGLNTATTSASRTFPDLAQVLTDNTNAETGRCPDAPAVPTPVTGRSNVPVPTVECFAEFLPTAEYGAPAAGLPSLGATLDFRLTARDEAPEGGGTQFDDVSLTVDTATGPFLVTSRDTAGSPATGGATETVTWAVNGTDAADLAPQVRILLSTDGGLTFPTVLAAATTNDGMEQVLLPAVTTSRARIKIEAVDNYFFDVNDAAFSIITPGVPETPGTPGTPGTPVTTTPTTTGGRVSTRTRVRLPQRQVVRGQRARLRSVVVAAVASPGTAGRVVVRVDGRKVLVRAATVQPRRAASRVLRLPRSLAAGTHRVRVVFRPSAGTEYAASRSRTVTVRVVGG